MARASVPRIRTTSRRWVTSAKRMVNTSNSSWRSMMRPPLRFGLGALALATALATAERPLQGIPAGLALLEAAADALAAVARATLLISVTAFPWLLAVDDRHAGSYLVSLHPHQHWGCQRRHERLDGVTAMRCLAHAACQLFESPQIHRRALLPDASRTPNRYRCANLWSLFGYRHK